MTPSELRYQASRDWMQAEIAAGRPIQHRRLTLSVDLDSLEPDVAQRVEAIQDGTLLLAKSRRIKVLDSGIEPDKKFGQSDDDLVPMDDPIVHVVGELPELPAPSDDLDDVLSAWESWIARYCGEALKAIDALNRERPEGKNSFGGEIRWAGIKVPFTPAAATSVKPDDGPIAMRDARAAWAWKWAAQLRFSAESVAAAEEATTPALEQAKEWIEVGDADSVASRFLVQMKQMYSTAKAHDAARRAQEPDFDAEMARWASKHGSARLQLGIEDGYRMNARYLTERLAAEAPGFFAMPVNSATKDWAHRTASPTEQALRLRRLVDAAVKSTTSKSEEVPEVEILTVSDPPPQMYLAQDGHNPSNDLPAKDGWPWWTDQHGDPYSYGPDAFEAVVVRNWLGRFHLIGAVPDEVGFGPAGIWAVPALRHFQEDGTVESQNPDAPTPNAAKRKPPRPGEEDDIPF